MTTEPPAPDAGQSEPYARVPASVARDPKISRDARATYAVLQSYAWQTDICWPSMDQLCTDLGACEKSVYLYLRDLVNAGLLKIEQRGLRRTNVYRLLVTAPGTRPGQYPVTTPASKPAPDQYAITGNPLPVEGLSSNPLPLLTGNPLPLKSSNPLPVLYKDEENSREENSREDTTSAEVGADAPPTAQTHTPTAQTAPTEESLPPARTAAEQQEPESIPGCVFEEDVPPPVPQAPPTPARQRRQSAPAAAPVADTPTLVQARALLATLGVAVTPTTETAMGNVVEKWAERCETACGMTLEEKALDARCWLDGPVARQKRRQPSVQFFRGWVERDTKEAETRPATAPAAPPPRYNGRARAAPPPEVQAERDAITEARRQKQIEKYGHADWF